MKTKAESKDPGNHGVLESDLKRQSTKKQHLNHARACVDRKYAFLQVWRALNGTAVIICLFFFFPGVPLSR